MSAFVGKIKKCLYLALKKLNKEIKVLDFIACFCYNIFEGIVLSACLLRGGYLLFSVACFRIGVKLTDWRDILMISRDVTIINTVGLHARPATFFIQKANSYKSSIWVEKEDRRVNAKSLLGVLSLGIVKDMTITLLADGSDEVEALNGLAEMIESGFAE